MNTMLYNEGGQKSQRRLTQWDTAGNELGVEVSDHKGRTLDATQMCVDEHSIGMQTRQPLTSMGPSKILVHE